VGVLLDRPTRLRPSTEIARRTFERIAGLVDRLARRLEQALGADDAEAAAMPRRRRAELPQSAGRADGHDVHPPTPSSQAGSEISRLRALPRSGAGERARERRQMQRALQQRPGDATAIRARDVRGYGSDCQWSR
jgi:hypothetical protein